MDDLTVYAEEISETLSMADLLEYYGFTLSRSGYISCPFHNEKTGSLKVWRDHWYCFGCGAYGNQIVFVRRFFDLSFEDSIKRLNEDFNLGLPIGERMTIRRSREIKKRRQELEDARRRERLRRERVTTQYFDLIDRYLKLQEQKRKFKPSPGDQELHPKFIEALDWLEYVDYLINSFEEGGPAA